jgi:hypothetical protein
MPDLPSKVDISNLTAHFEMTAIARVGVVCHKYIYGILKENSIYHINWY